MLAITSSYSKKIPIPGQPFSSQSFMTTVQTEVSSNATPQEIERKIAETYDIVKRSVDSELEAATSQPSSQYSNNQPRNNNQSRHHNRPKNNPPRNDNRNGEPRQASNKQIAYILDLSKSQNLDLRDLNQMAMDQFQASSLYELTSSDASKLIGDLQSKAA